MPPTKIKTPRSGQVELQKWFDQGPPFPQVVKISDEIVPQQDMLEYQQRRFWIDLSLSVAQGNQAQFVIEVPVDEAWEVDLINILNGDSVKHEYQLTWRAPALATFPRMAMFTSDVDSLVVTNIFPVRNYFSDANGRKRFEYTGRMKLGPGESIMAQSQDGVTDVGPVTERFSMKAHRIPIPVEQIERQGLIVGTTF